MLQTNKPEILKKVFCGLASFNEDIIFRIAENQLFFSIMSRDNTSLIVIKIPKTIFQKYDFKSEEDIKVSSQLIKQIFSKVVKDDVVYISLGEFFDLEKTENIDTNNPIMQKHSQMQITLSSTKYKKTYQIPLINITEEEQIKSKEPELKHDISVTTNNKELLEMLDSLIFTTIKSYGDTITLTADGSKIDLKEETKYGKSILTLKDFDKQGLKQKVSVKLSYNLLKPLITFQGNLCETSIYNFKDSYPLKVSGKSEDIETYFILAPRVDQDDSK